MRQITVEYEPAFYPRARGCIHVGDTVDWRGCWGTFTPVPVKVIAMELSEEPRARDGVPVPVVTAAQMRANRVVFTLANNSWAYASQITARAEQ